MDDSKNLAPDFPAGLRWFNVARPLSLSDLRGRAVLLDFWTGGEIACHHNAAQLRIVGARVGPELAIVGVHAGKFAGEQDARAAQEALLRLAIEHPVVVDRERELWNAYEVKSWPTLVLLDPVGRIVGGFAGELDADKLVELVSRHLRRWRDEGLVDGTALETRSEAQREHRHLLRFPSKLSCASEAHIYVADTGHNRILELELDAHGREAFVRRSFGSGVRGLKDGQGDEAHFDAPRGLALMGRKLCVADTGNHCVRAIDLDTGRVATIAGTGEVGLRLPRPGHPLRTALRSPWALWWDRPRLYVALAGSHQLAAIEGEDLLLPLAGNGREALVDGPALEASFNQPSDLAGDGRALYIADAEASALRRLELVGRPRVDTLVGQGLHEWGDRDGQGAEVRLQRPAGLCFDGLLYIADTLNHKIKQMDPATRRTTRLAGSGERGHADGHFVRARFHGPEGLAVRDRRLYVADTGNHVVRVLDLRHMEAWTLVVHD